MLLPLHEQLDGGIHLPQKPFGIGRVEIVVGHEFVLRKQLVVKAIGAFELRLIEQNPGNGARHRQRGCVEIKGIEQFQRLIEQPLLRQGQAQINFILRAFFASQELAINQRRILPLMIAIIGCGTATQIHVGCEAHIAFHLHRYAGRRVGAVKQFFISEPAFGIAQRREINQLAGVRSQVFPKTRLLAVCLFISFKTYAQTQIGQHAIEFIGENAIPPVERNFVMFKQGISHWPMGTPLGQCNERNSLLKRIADVEIVGQES